MRKKGREKATIDKEGNKNVYKERLGEEDEKKLNTMSHFHL